MTVSKTALKKIKAIPYKNRVLALCSIALNNAFGTSICEPKALFLNSAVGRESAVNRNNDSIYKA